MKKKLPQIVREIQNNKPEPVNFAYEKNISYSQLSMYTQCPKKWALQYRDGHKVKEQSIHMTFGTAYTRHFRCILILCIIKVLLKLMN
jgi:hypothetical protein